MALLNDEQKRFIVQCLACYDTPSRVVDAVKEEFGLTISRQHVQGYDPTKYLGRNLSLKWRTLFEDTRKRFREESAEVPIAQRAFRLRTLNRLMEKAEGMRNIQLVLQTLEQAAKEVGDVYINRQTKPAEPREEDASPTKIEVTVVDARKQERDESGES